MNLLYEAAKEVSDFMRERKWKFCIIGGLAVIRWGEQRHTQDVDLTLLTGFGEEEMFAQTLLERFVSRMPDAKAFVLRNRVLLIKASNGASLDVSFGAFPFEKRVIRRATLFEFAPGYVFPTCSAEDLIVMKSFAGRPTDWRDVEMIKVRQKKRINWKLVIREIKPLATLKEAPEIVERLAKLAKS